MPETGDISKLAYILHQNGDKVLSALSKLSLNATLLQRINKEFELFLENDSGKEGNNFQVLGSSNSSQMIQDLHFLHDFIQKTVGLKISNIASLALLDNKVDISKFKSIKYLEIKKVPVKEIIGLKVVQSQLESIVCIRCLSKLEEVLAECGGDNSNGFVWSELKEAVISYNNIRVLDTSVAFAPWLQVLDLSHNQLVDVKAIECLPSLKYVNLSFNCLNSVPSFSKSSRKKMQVLVLKNNYIEEVSGLAGLDYLTELDLSWNWISNYECLHPFLTMSALQNLCLKGNPINYCKHYKQNVLGYLHISASFSEFVLDGSKISKVDRSVVGYKLCQVTTQSGSFVESVSSSISRTPSATEQHRIVGKTSSSKKGSKVRIAVIPNLDDGSYEEMPADISGINLNEHVSTEHLITKKMIEDTRATYGSDNWLRCEAGSVVQCILGLPPSEILSSTPLDDRCLEAALQSENNQFKTQAIIENHPKDETPSNYESFTTCPDNHSVNYYSIDNSNSLQENTKGNSMEESKETSPDFEAIQESSEEIEDENEKIFLVSRLTKNGQGLLQKEEIFLTLCDMELKEKDSNRGRVINKWSISSLMSSTILEANKLHLTYDTIKNDKRDRIYEMEQNEANELHKILFSILESRTLQDMNQIGYKCMTCSSQFSKIINPRKQENVPQCPFCNSKLLLEAVDYLPEEKDKTIDLKLKKEPGSGVKPSHKRSDSAGVVQGSTNKPDKVAKCSSQSSIGSAASLDELSEHQAVRGINIKQSDSDIEILSNPSQSSIEVIDGPSRLYNGSTPGRKRSEERQIIQTTATSSETGTQIGNVGLTESSSSGSVTDSVCTAYETNSGPTLNYYKADNINVIVEEPKEINAENNTSHTVMEAEEITEKIDKKSITNKKTDEVQYSYTDFTKIDHRIKLLLYSQIFEDNNEEFCFILRCSVLLSNSTNSIQSCVICSNKYLYILKVTGPEEGDDASNFLKKSNSLRFFLKSLKSITALIWNQGLSIKFRDTHDKKDFLILLKDQKRTQYFLEFLLSSDLILPSNCAIITEFSSKPILAMQHLLICGASEDSNIKFFSLLNYGSVVKNSVVNEIKTGAILTNSVDFLLFDSEPTWLFDGSNSLPQPVCSQKLSNLMSVETEGSRIYLQFLYDFEEKEEIWDLRMETQETVDGLINSIKVPWEELFSVPLQISHA